MRLLLVPQQWVEERVDKIRVRDFIVETEKAGQEVSDLVLPPLSHLADLTSANGQTFGETVELGQRVESAQPGMEFVKLSEIRPISWGVE